MKQEELIDLFRLLVELNDNKKIPKKYKRQLEININFLKVVIQDPDSCKQNKKGFARLIGFVLKIINSS